MSLKLSIHFDNEESIYYPGHVISGKVTLEIDSEVKVKGLTLTFLGEAEVYWTEAEATNDTISPYLNSNNSQGRAQRRRHVQKEFRNQETVLWHEILLFGQGEAEGGSDFTIKPGIKDYRFRYQLPPHGLPSTYTESPFGSIRFTVEARLKRPLFRYDKSVKEFIVKGVTDLNLVPRTLHPIGANERIDVGWVCCPNGYMTIDFQLPKSGFLWNEMIPFTLSIVNLSSALVYDIFATLQQNIRFHTFDRKKTISRNIQVISCEPLVESYGVARWNEKFLVSSELPPSTLAGCRAITFNYSIKVTVRTSEETCFLSCPIFVGNEPCPFNSTIQTLEVENSINQQPSQIEYNPALNPFLQPQQEEELCTQKFKGNEVSIAYVDEDSDSDGLHTN